MGLREFGADAVGSGFSVGVESLGFSHVFAKNIVGSDRRGLLMSYSRTYGLAFDFERFQEDPESQG